jgi:hypothetical protein
VIAAHDDVTAEAAGSSGTIVSYTSPATADAVDGAGTAACLPASGSAFGLGNTTVTCSATDVAGNAATPTTFVVRVVDTTVPVIAVPTDISTGPTGPSGATVTYSASATDLVDGSLTPNCLPAAGSLFGFGTTTVTCSATDSHGNTGSKTFNVTISSFTFQGFFQPVDNPGTGTTMIVNTVKNGSTVPVKWKLQGQGGAEITSVSAVAIGWPKMGSISCNALTSGAEAPIETTVTGGTSLRYDSTGMQFIYNWQTQKQVGTCWRLDVKFTDGTTKSAYFKLK